MQAVTVNCAGLPRCEANPGALQIQALAPWLAQPVLGAQVHRLLLVALKVNGDHDLKVAPIRRVWTHSNLSGQLVAKRGDERLSQVEDSLLPVSPLAVRRSRHDHWLVAAREGHVEVGDERVDKVGAQQR